MRLRGRGFMNNNEDIDIYELVNDLSFDLDDIVER